MRSLADPGASAADEADTPDTCIVADERARKNTGAAAKYVDLAIR
jgi:hypothetical protein